MQEKARNEVIAALSEKDDDLELSDIELPYLSAFIKESLRIFPTINNNGRVAGKDCHFGDYFVPKKTFVFFSNVVLNRDPDTFDSPDEFIPERYLEGKIYSCGRISLCLIINE